MDQNVMDLKLTTVKTQLPDFIYKRIKESVYKSNSYYSQPLSLLQKLSKKHGVAVDNTFLTSGIDEAIQMFILAHPGRVLAFTPTYIEYSRATDLGCEFLALNAYKEGDYIAEAKAYDADLIFLANPNNPFGGTSSDKIKELLVANPETVVCIDEAYGEFAPELSVIGLIEEFPNLAVFRSFSKDYGMAGARIGYVVANQNLIKAVSGFTHWSNVSSLSIAAASVALENESYYKKMREEIIESRIRVTKDLIQLGYLVLPSYINAILLKFKKESIALGFVNHLERHQISVSYGNGESNIGLDNRFVRIAIGTPFQMNQFINVVKELK